MQGVLLVGHGTRDLAGAAEFLATAKLVASARPQVPVEPCFLELADPPIAMGITRLAARGVDEIVVMPLLLFAAGHAKQDVPQAVNEALQSLPHVRWRQAEHLGCHPAILAQSAARFLEAIRDRTFVSRDRTSLVFVGRGSHDDEATREMHRFATLARQCTKVGRTEVCFFAMAKPSLAETLEQVAAAGYQRIIVQPHLLFDGLLLAGIRAAVQTNAAKYAQSEWLTVDRLGPTPKLSTAIWERIDQARTSHFQTVARTQVSVATNLK